MYKRKNMLREKRKHANAKPNRRWVIEPWKVSKTLESAKNFQKFVNGFENFKYFVEAKLKIEAKLS